MGLAGTRDHVRRVLTRHTRFVPAAVAVVLNSGNNIAVLQGFCQEALSTSLTMIDCHYRHLGREHTIQLLDTLNARTRSLAAVDVRGRPVDAETSPLTPAAEISGLAFVLGL